MGLSSHELSLVPDGMDLVECYERIYRWHKKYGRNKLKDKNSGDSNYCQTYLALLDEFPVPEKTAQEDMDYIFSEVIWGSLEWAYHEEDKFGIKLAAYAQYAINKSYGDTSSEDFRKSIKSSRFFHTFNSHSQKRNQSKLMSDHDT